MLALPANLKVSGCGTAAAVFNRHAPEKHSNGGGKDERFEIR